MQHAYLVRYGLMRHVARFEADSDGYERGQVVVVRSHRGQELGEVLIRTPALPEPGVSSADPAPIRILQAAGPEDLERARQFELDRPRRLEVCERILQDGTWPLQLIDVEPLLDDRRTVLHYLGPHRLDVSGLRTALHDLCGLDVLLEPAGLDVAEDEAEDEAEVEAEGGCGHCGSGAGGCGSGGGCGSSSASHGRGCSGCAVKELVRSRR